MDEVQMLSFLYSQLSNILFPHFYICDRSGRDFPFLNNCVLVHVCVCLPEHASVLWAWLWGNGRFSRTWRSRAGGRWLAARSSQSPPGLLANTADRWVSARQRSQHPLVAEAGAELTEIYSREPSHLPGNQRSSSSLQPLRLTSASHCCLSAALRWDFETFGINTWSNQRPAGTLLKSISYKHNIPSHGVPRGVLFDSLWSNQLNCCSCEFTEKTWTAYCLLMKPSGDRTRTRISFI